MRNTFSAVLLLLLAMMLSGCGYNTIQQKDEAVNAAWSQVINVYKRRADLIPNLVATVRGYASHEERVLTEVTEARARVGSINVNANDPASLAQFQAAQAQLQGALSRLLVVSEQYPQLKADQNFLQLQAQLEGTENRIAVERQRYIGTVQDYNTYIRQFPTNITAKMFGYKPRPNFTVENEAQISDAPSVDFGTPPAVNTAPPATTAPAPSTAPSTAPQALPPSAPLQPSTAPAPVPAPATSPTPQTQG